MREPLDPKYIDEVIEKGLSQIPTPGIKRLKQKIDAGKRVLVNGEIVSTDGRFG